MMRGSYNITLIKMFVVKDNIAPKEHKIHVSLYVTGCNDKLKVSFYLQVLNNIELYLQEEERRMIKQDQECKYFMLIYCLLPRPKTFAMYKESQKMVFLHLM